MRSLTAGRAVVELVEGDITQVAADAIVNPANEALVLGGGVAGAIRRAGGPAIQAECDRLGGCPTGEAKVTGAGRLPARYVIHAVGPVWAGGGRGEPELLASAYRASLQRADELGLRSVAFPSISTGVYGYPLAAAARVALRTVRDYLRAGAPADATASGVAASGGARVGSRLERVLFVLFGAAALAAFEEALAELGG